MCKNLKIHLTCLYNWFPPDEMSSYGLDRAQAIVYQTFVTIFNSNKNLLLLKL